MTRVIIIKIRVIIRDFERRICACIVAGLSRHYSAVKSGYKKKKIVREISSFFILLRTSHMRYGKENKRGNPRNGLETIHRYGVLWDAEDR